MALFNWLLKYVEKWGRIKIILTICSNCASIGVIVVGPYQQPGAGNTKNRPSPKIEIHKTKPNQKPFGVKKMAGGGGRGGMIKVLNVAEKPSVAKAVSGILSRGQGLRVREGRSRYNKIFEFVYTINAQQCQMSFTSVTGHLMELEFEDRYRKWHSCDPVDLYNAPVRKHVPQVTSFFLSYYFH